MELGGVLSRRALLKLQGSFREAVYSWEIQREELGASVAWDERVLCPASHVRVLGHVTRVAPASGSLRRLVGVGEVLWTPGELRSEEQAL